MRKRFKKVYIEITNSCNLQCSFCEVHYRPKQFMSLENFEEILKKINDYTDYVYLHVMGEPLLHPQLKEILNLCDKYHKKVNITTNGTLLLQKKELLKTVRQINVSIHNIFEFNHTQDYLVKLLQGVEDLAKYSYISLRVWTLENNQLTKKNQNLITQLEQYYKQPIMIKNQKLKENIYLNFDHLFQWPSLKREKIGECGFCHALKDHIAILVNGDVIFCCLDSKGDTCFGNLLVEEMKDILAKDSFKKCYQGFQQRKLLHPLCQRCQFIQKFS